MKIVIDIDDNIYHRFVNGFANDDDAYLIEQLFKNGTPLPKGYGDLIDRDVALADFDKAGLSKKEMIGKLVIFGTPTVIPADK